MPITLPVPGGGGATTPSTYYNGTNLGEYQFVSLKEIIANFIAAYTGEGKILENVLRADVKFHAHRALQELHYDTVKSCKSQEIEVCSSLKMPLPHDYVNYVKLSWIDTNGIQHIIYPTRNTSNPFAIQQNDDCSYAFENGDLMQQQTCTIESLSCSASEIPDIANDLFGKTDVGKLSYNKAKKKPDYDSDGNGPGGDAPAFFQLDEKGRYNYLENFKDKVDNYCNCTDTLYSSVLDKPCGEKNSYEWMMFDCLVGKTLGSFYTYEKNGVTMNDCIDFLGVAYDDSNGDNGGPVKPPIQ